MVTFVELVIFLMVTLGALGVLSYLIAEWLAERGIWPMVKETPETCRSQTPLEASNAGR